MSTWDENDDWGAAVSQQTSWGRSEAPQRGGRGRQDGGWSQAGGGRGQRARANGSDSGDWRGNGSVSLGRGRRGNGRPRSPGGRRGEPPGDASGGGNLHLDVNAADVGRIIGSGGAKIRELETESGARIKVNSDDSGSSTVRVDFYGSPVNQERGKEMVRELLQPEPGSRSLNSMFQQQPAKPKFNLQLALQMQEQGDKVRWSNAKPMVKDFYTERAEVTNMTSDEVAAIRYRMNEISVKCNEPTARLLNPVVNFEQAYGDYPEILAEVARAGFKEPTPIQAQGWPILLSGQDMIGIAQTGSGKTLAFLLPALVHTDRQPIPREQRGGPNVLVLSPTRELAMQTEKEVKRFNYRGIRSACIYGGGDRRTQVKQVCEGVEIIIATPGRLNDLVQAGYIDVTSITYLVLDEADRMLDMGFEAEIRKVLLDIRPDRQTVMTSATWPVDVRRIADKYMNDPVHVVVGSLDLRACRTVEQIIIYCEDEDDKKAKLDQYLFNMSPEDKIIVFFGRKAKAGQLSIDYGVNGVDLQSIHGDRPQEEREIAIEDMQSGSCRVLFATDVASRGIDIPDITLIINFDFPRHIEDYVHRVGRTGRAGKYGCAVTFMCRGDWRHAAELIDILEKNQAEVPEFLSDMSNRFTRMKDRRGPEGGDGDRRGRGGGRRGGEGGRGGRGRRRHDDMDNMFPGFF